MHLRIALGLGVLASLVSACSGSNSTALPPGSGPPQTPSSPIVRATSAIATRNVNQGPLSQTMMQGVIVNIRTGGFTVRDAIRSGGNVPVTYQSNTPINTWSAPLAIGNYAIVVGTGSSGKGEAANYIAIFKTAPPVLTLSGTFENQGNATMTIKDSSTGSMIPIMLYDQTKMTGSLVKGASVSVTGNGTISGAVLASSVTSGVQNSPTPMPTGKYPQTISQTHLVTGDYLGTPWGANISPATAAPYLSWVQTAVGNTTAFANAGMKTEVYFSPDRTQTDDPLYALASGSDFATTCSSTRIYTIYNGISQYLMNPESSDYRSKYGTYVAQTIAPGKVNAIFEDNGSLPSHYPTGYYLPSMPCNYDATTWLNAEAQIEDAPPIPTIINGLSGLENENVSPLLALMSNWNTMGGNFESCISNTAGKPNNGAWVWQATENSQIYVLAHHKTFQCMGLDKTAATLSYAPRMYMLASFLMTYDPQLSIFWESYATPSGFHVFPESKFVALYPTTSQPTAISALKTSQGPYTRTYNACYYAGKFVGPCEMVVNSDYYPEPTPPLAAGLHHTISVSGNDVLGGGSISFSGAAAPTEMNGETGFVAVP